jgi:hypothetical protein
MASEFDRARMQMQDLLLHEGQLTPAARLVGIELLRRVNRVCGYAWPRSQSVATALGLALRTVKEATKELERTGYFRVDRNVDGRSNRYWPCFQRRANSAPLPDVESSAKNVRMECKQERERRAKNVPLSLRMRPSTAPSTGPHESTAAGHAAIRSTQREDHGEMRAQRGDEQVERMVSNALGPDGDEILGALHSIDGGRPYYRLIAAGREGVVDERELIAARLAYQQQLAGTAPLGR